MNAAGRLAIFGAGLVAVFAAAFAIAAVVVPDSAVASWKEKSMSDHGSEHSGMAESSNTVAQPGLSLAQDGYMLSPVTAPARVGEQGALTFQIQTVGGQPVKDFAAEHDKDLHLMVVRSDGSHYRHVHPTLDRTTGTWTLPWQWEAAGTYRVFADFQTAGDNPAKVTLTRTVDAAGDFTPEVPTAARTTDSVDGFDVALTGDLFADKTSDLDITITRDGQPVTGLQPYLGAFGHLVALRQGDLAYLHVHAEGDDPKPGQTSGPTIAFMSQAPTPGRYLMYLDFQVDGQVHTATFVVDAAGTGAPEAAHDPHSGGH